MSAVTAETDLVEQVTTTVTPLAEWLYLTHPGFDGSTRIPNDLDVLAAHLARGWVESDPPDTSGPGVPAAGAGPVDDAGAWIDMVHPASGGTQRLPNNADALAGAREAGWVTTTEAAAVETGGLTVAEVLEAVGEDPAKAEAALAAEQTGKNRTSLIRALEAIVASAPQPTVNEEL